MTSTRRRVAPLIAFGVAIGLSACGGDRLVLPEEGRPAKITIVSGDAQSAAAGGVLGEALVVRVTDAQNRPVEDQAVAFTIDAGGGQVAPASVQTGTDGQASSSWTLGGAAGAQRVQATVDDDNLPATLLVMFNASAVSGVGAVLALESGDNQTAAVGSALPDSLVVRVTDLLGNPAAGVPVDWSVDGGGSISPATVLTGADGKAAAERVLGNTAGPQTAQAASGALTPVSFAHTAGAANPTVLVLESGNGQTGPVGAELADSLVVRLMDDNGNGVGGKPITWVVGTGGGAVNPSTATTNPNGFAKTAWTLGPNVGSNLVNAVFSGLPSVPFTATGGAGVATKLAFIQPPLTTSAGATITPAVRVAIQDAAGNTVTAASNTVTVALGDNPGGAVLSGTLTVSAVNGVASFPNLSIDKTGNGYTLTAVADGLDGTTSPAFDILTGNANRLVFIVEPTDRTVGQQFSPSIQVQVQDVGGNPVLTASNSITLTSSVSGTLSGNAVATPILGTATFSNLAINKAGNDYTLTAFSSGVTSRTSVDFDVAQAGTTVAITGDNPDPSVPGQNVTVAYDVNISAPGAGGLTGTVTVGVVGDGAVSCTGSISAGLGTGACTLSFPSAGTQDLVATYSGDANFVGSASPAVQHVVNQANTTIAIQPESPATSVVGEAVTVQWNLTSPGSVPLTGTVTLTVGGGAETCSSPAALGSGSCALTFTSSGSRPITATYSGDANYNGSSDGEPHTVIP
ncbi:MAG: Ig-like domain repeat protein, partial [Gemmatimonadales bacterium]|nr:Ig-like domain repeat protein [Gemmatimonadales bacterium]